MSSVLNKWDLQDTEYIEYIEYMINIGYNYNTDLGVKNIFFCKIRKNLR